MNCSSRFIVRSLGAAIAAALVLIVSSCASGDGGSSGPAKATVKITLVSEPAAGIMINNTLLDNTPTTVNIEVDDSGFLIYPVKITFDYSKTIGGRNAPKSSVINWLIGKLPPAKITVSSGIITESRDAAPKNPPGTKASAGEF